MLDFTRLILISTQVEVVIEVGVELGNKKSRAKQPSWSQIVVELGKNIPEEGLRPEPSFSSKARM